MPGQTASWHDSSPEPTFQLFNFSVSVRLAGVWQREKERKASAVAHANGEREVSSIKSLIARKKV